ncbi:PAS domain S-box protein [Desulfoluna sp.]|uniref:PAS domain S-box protein n=1 Tax=Desulfoluna sp. TaxID=2045199 RepID=UPI0026234405|nr:PAS domain S-box protein [Desulfoluna sp.]
MQNHDTPEGGLGAISFSSEKVRQEIDAIERYHSSLPEGDDRDVDRTVQAACAYLRHVNRVQLAVRQSLWSAFGEKSFETLIQRVCRALVDSGGYDAVWIVLIGPDGGCQTWAQAGLGSEAVVLDRIFGAGWFPRCGHQRCDPDTDQKGGQVQPDIHCETCPFGELCRPPGSLVARLAFGAIELGMMSVTLSPDVVAGDAEVSLLQEVAGDLSHALYDVSCEQQRYDTEVGLGESRRAMATLLTNLPGMAYRCRLDDPWTMLLVSEGSVSLTGYHADELIGNRVIAYGAMIHPDDRSMVQKAVDEGVANSGSFEMEYRLRARNGKEKWVWERGTAVRFGDSVVALEGFVTDITERKRALEELQLSHRRYHILVEDMPAMVCRFLPDGRLTDVNESYCRMFGMERSALVGHNFFTFLLEDAREHVRRHFLSLTPEHPMATYEHEVITPDGRRGWQEWTDRAIFSDQGTLCEFQSIGRDTTERRSAEEALRASEKRYRAYVDNSPVGIFIFDDEGRYIEANASVCQMLGYSQAELKALNVNALSVSDGVGQMAPIVERLKQEGYIQTEIPVLHKNGGVVYGRLEAVALDSGQYIAYFIDQTEQRKLAAQLQQVQKIESVGRLAAGVAHDFNNMLSPILGYAELLIDELPAGTECSGYALEVKNAAERSRNLVRQLLAFSRKQVLRLDHLDLRGIVSGMEALLKRTLRENIELVLELAESPCPVRADVGQVEQILMNLAVNAQDAMPDGGELSLAVRMAVQDAMNPRFHLELSPGSYVLLEVMDTGVGMDPATAEQAFEPFYSTKGKGGTGLGLSTVYGIVAQHGGTVLMDTQQGKGTRFSFYFPSEDEMPIEGVAAPRKESPSVSGDETVLVVEDNEVVRNMTVSVLTRQGYCVYNAASAEEALAFLDEFGGTVDLLLTDVVMPGMNGRELYTQVSALYSGVRALYMSGYSDDVIAHHGVLEEGIHFIQKPFTIEALTRKVRDVLERA